MICKFLNIVLKVKCVGIYLSMFEYMYDQNGGFKIKIVGQKIGIKVGFGVFFLVEK